MLVVVNATGKFWWNINFTCKMNTICEKKNVAWTTMSAIKQNFWIFKPLFINMSVVRYIKGFSFLFCHFFTSMLLRTWFDIAKPRSIKIFWKNEKFWILKTQNVKNFRPHWAPECKLLTTGIFFYNKSVILSAHIM